MALATSLRCVRFESTETSPPALGVVFAKISGRSIVPGGDLFRTFDSASISYCKRVTKTAPLLVFVGYMQEVADFPNGKRHLRRKIARAT